MAYVTWSMCTWWPASYHSCVYAWK